VPGTCAALSRPLSSRFAVVVELATVWTVTLAGIPGTSVLVSPAGPQV
jgi:hypothetical protein